MPNRVTLGDIEAEIAGECYVNAGDAARAVSSVLEYPERIDLLTFCILELSNGYIVTGESICVSPEIFDAEIGRKLAREDALRKIWPLLGFRLCEENMENQNA